MDVKGFEDVESYTGAINKIVSNCFNDKASLNLITYCQLTLFRILYPASEFNDLNNIQRRRKYIEDFLDSIELNFEEYVNVNYVGKLREEIAHRALCSISTPL